MCASGAGLARDAGETAGSYGRVWGEVDLLRQAHEQHVGPLGEPFVAQLLLGGGALDVVGRLQTAQQVCEGGVHILRERRHGADVCGGVPRGKSRGLKSSGKGVPE